MGAAPEVIDQALQQVERGFAVFALRPNGKRPATEHGFKNATTNPDWVVKQLEAPSAGNYGMTWPEDAEYPVVVFDLDNGEDGRERPWQERLTELIATLGPLPKTKATTTPSGGRHAFYRWPKSLPLPPGDDLFGFTVRWPGRGYLVGPGSSIDGRTYTNGGTDGIAELPPSWVYAAIAEKPGRTADASGGVITITGAFELPAVIPSGQRYSTIRDYVASRYNTGLSREELWALVQAEVAPRFNVPKDDATLRADFDRTVAKITERLGPPRKGLAVEDAIAAVSPVEVVNLADIAVEAVSWLWHRYLPVGSITLFDGNPGEGKSTVVADLIARLTTGSEWADGTPVGAPGDVLYVTKEDDPATQVRPRIEAAGGDVRHVLFVKSDLLFPRDLARFRELLLQQRPRLVLLDPLMSYLEGKVRVISDNEVRSALMTPLAEIAREVAAAVLVIRHFNKTVGSSALLRGAGSLGGLAGAARMVIALAVDPDEDDERAKVFGVVKSNYEAKPPSLKVLIESAPVEGFLMTVSRATWSGASSTSIGDAMEQSREEHEQVRAAEAELRQILSDAGGTLPSKEAIDKMTARRHSRSSAYRAARGIHARIERSGFQGGSTWSLPDATLIRANSGTNETNDDETNETNETNGSEPSRARRNRTLDEINEMNENGWAREAGHSSHSSIRDRGGVRAPAREGDDEVAVGRRPDGTIWCRDFRAHQTKHFSVSSDPTCPICKETE